MTVIGNGVVPGSGSIDHVDDDSSMVAVAGSDAAAIMVASAGVGRPGPWPVWGPLLDEAPPVDWDLEADFDGL